MKVIAFVVIVSACVGVFAFKGASTVDKAYQTHRSVIEAAEMAALR